MDKLALFRVDGSYNIGSGHIHRCLIIADALAEQGFTIHFICEEITDGYQRSIKTKNYLFSKIEDDSTTGKSNIDTLIQRAGSTYRHKILIFDSDIEELYERSFQQNLIQAGWKLMYITFHNHYDFLADIILNQNIRAPLLDYRTSDKTISLLGTKYLIFSEGFRQLNSIPHYADKEEILFLFFGGADYKGRTLSILNQIKDTQLFSKIHVVVGALNRQKEKISHIVNMSKGLMELHVQTDIIHELMSESKYAISSGGLSLWELALCNVLQIVIPTSERENLTLDYCSTNNLVHSIENYENLGPEELKDAIEDKIMSEGNVEMVNTFSKRINRNGLGLVIDAINKVLI